MKYRMAYFGIPHFGGTYTVYRSLRAGLLPHGIEVRWLGISRSPHSSIDETMWAHELPNGDLISGHYSSDAQLGQAMNSHIEKHYDGVFVTVLGSRVQTNAVRYLPERIRRIMIVHTPSPGTLNAAKAVVGHVHATVAVSERTRSELVSRYAFNPRSTSCIPNAIDLDNFRSVEREISRTKTLRLLSFGRIEEAAKGVFWLPKIMAKLSDKALSLTVAGDGPDRAELERRFSSETSRVRFLGRVADARVPELYAEHDIFLMPSRMGGFGQTLVEAMAAGCVPLASRIKGVTDTIISHGRDGYLFRMGDCSDAASAIVKLADDRQRLKEMSDAARGNVLGRFDLATQGAAFADLIDRLLADPPSIAKPLSFDRWSYPRRLLPGLRTRLPDPIKNVLRTWRERLAA